VKFCETHGLLLATVADLVAFRLRRDPIVRRLESRRISTSWGELAWHRFESVLDGIIHEAFVLGELSGAPPLVRVHLASIPEDLEGFGSTSGGPFHAAMSRIRDEGRGLMVYLRRPAETRFHSGPPTPLRDRDFGVGAQILRDLGVHGMRLLSRSEKKYIGLRGFGLDIVSTVPLDHP
jgi:3,4-dihydroxy 2-butanone 4-phosphate synthase/GTP cyclohydrolase II